VSYLAELYKPLVNAETLISITKRVNELGLTFAPQELTLIAALDHPDKVQQFLDTHIYYNYDHPVPGHDHSPIETTMSPKQVLKTGKGHCYEGGLFSYVVNYLHGYQPGMVLLESRLNDSDHNIIVWRDKNTGLWGSNGQSGYEGLGGRSAEYKTLQELAYSYAKWYYHPETNDPADITLVGYSHPVDLVAKFGTDWMDDDQELWNMFNTYIDETTPFSYITGDPTVTHMYPGVRAVQEHWIGLSPEGKGIVLVANLPTQAQLLWDEFKRLYKNEFVPRGETGEVLERFFAITGTTPLDLVTCAEELEK
jgi:hypothetical protein